MKGLLFKQAEVAEEDDTQKKLLLVTEGKKLALAGAHVCFQLSIMNFRFFFLKSLLRDLVKTFEVFFLSCVKHDGECLSTYVAFAIINKR